MLRLIFFIFLLAGINCTAQQSESKSKLRFTYAADLKGAYVLNELDEKIFSREVFFGYRFFNSAVIEIGLGDFYRLNKNTTSFDLLNHYGIGIKYQYLLMDKPIGGDLVIEPNVRVNQARNRVNDAKLYFYSIGLNFVPVKTKYFHFGLGFMHSLNGKNSIGLYYNLGIRL